MDPDERLRQLLRWKRWERPDGASWARFDVALQERRLRALVKESVRKRLLRLLHRVVRPGLAMAGMLGAAVVLTHLPSYSDGLAGPREMEFLLLTLEGEIDGLESELFSEADDGVCYVASSIPSGGNALLTAYHF
ncbi:MAG: hypothetical protein LBP65_03565 [Puniceicoccales bacterium]|jgi:hypothetical protein|nr:hypothetical protein [Puniceicoccales bacterium]